MKALILAGEGFEDLELFYSYYRLIEEGIEVDVASNKKVVDGNHGYKIRAINLSEVNPEEYEILIIPGGKGPESIRTNRKAVEITEHFLRENKTIAAICHGPQRLISARAVKGKKLTSWKGIRDDLIAAGAEYINQEVVVDSNIITSRRPSDLPAFFREIIKKIKE